MPKFEIDHYYNNSNDCETIEYYEKRFKNMDKAIEYATKNRKFREIYDDDNKTTILLKMNYYNRNGNIVYGKHINTDKHKSRSEIIDIAIIEDDF